MNVIQRISPYRHIIESQQFDKNYLDKILKLTDEIKNKKIDVSSTLKGSVGALLFYEASTRTRLSFESAILRLGGSFIHTENARDFSSSIKGETLSDSIRVISDYADYIILRHFDDDSSKVAVKHSNIPVINAGSGKEQHPTQTLIDIYTIFQSFGRLTNLNIMLIGDLAHGRTCTSLIYLLAKFPNNKFCFVSPDNCRARPNMTMHLKNNNVLFAEHSSLEQAMAEFDGDVLYVTRVQKERFSSPSEYLKAKSQIIFKYQHLSKLKEQAIIMHPLPRVDEIDHDIDTDPRVRYFEQTKNGLYVRMALLKMMYDSMKK
ncbi:MAG: aspartate carbamoyltransferase [SAR324 cluster bacterium]|nr:aspartate carbamoyltransferase [SAR324 cluster bacterium]